MESNARPEALVARAAPRVELLPEELGLVPVRKHHRVERLEAVRHRALDGGDTTDDLLLFQIRIDDDHDLGSDLSAKPLRRDVPELHRLDSGLNLAPIKNEKNMRGSPLKA